MKESINHFIQHFNQHFIHRQASIIKFTISLLIMMLILMSIPVQQVQADYNGGQGSGNTGSLGSLSGGPAESKTAVALYIIKLDSSNPNGYVRYTGAEIIAKKGKADEILAIPHNHREVVTKIGDLIPNRVYPSDLVPYPVRWNASAKSWEPNGDVVKAWLMSGTTEKEWEYWVKTIWGQSVYDDMQEDLSQYYIIVEPLAWMHPYSGDNGIDPGFNWLATSQGWAIYYDRLGQSNGDKCTYKMTHQALPYSMVLDRDYFGLGSHAGEGMRRLVNSEIIGSGYGIHIISLADPYQTTYDEPQGDTPSPAPTESTGQITIVKNYRIKNSTTNTYEDKGCYIKSSLSGKIQIEDELSYKVIGWKISTTTTPSPSISSITWESSVPSTITSTGTTPTTVDIKLPSSCLYILLEKSTSTPTPTPIEGVNYRLGESQITRRITLSEDDNGQAILKGYKFSWNYNSLNNCSGHRHEGSHTSSCGKDCTADHSYTSYCNFTLNDRKWTLNIKNAKEKEYPKNLSVNAWASEIKTEVNKERNSLSGGSVENEFDYEVVVHRGNDELSIAGFKNENADLNKLDKFITENNKSTVTRKQTDYKETITMSFEDDSSDKETSSSGTEGCNRTDEANLGNKLETEVGILYEVYSGSKQGGSKNTEINSSEMLTIGSNGTKISSGRMVKSGLEFSYHPYIKMRYDTMDSLNNKVYVLSEYKRSMSLNDYAEVIWTKTENENLTLSSRQWSTHAEPVKKWGTSSLLPGGATLSLGIKKENRQVVLARTYQCILVDDGREQVEKTSGLAVTGFTKETALENHKEYVDSVIKGLQGMSVSQWQNKNADGDPFGGIEVYNQANISSLGSTSTASSEDKYYFKNKRGGSNSGCLDVKEGGTNTTYYTFSSDTSGNILMNGEVILNKEQDASSLSGIAKEINARTYVVKKLLDSLERNKGNDLEADWVTDGAWYNEAFDGITVAVNTTQLTTGFIDPAERQAVLDPKLNTKSSGTADMFSSYNVGQFRMKDYSITYNTKNVIGLFKGTTVRMKDMQWLYKTKKFYISNITVQDLH